MECCIKAFAPPPCFAIPFPFAFDGFDFYISPTPACVAITHVVANGRHGYAPWPCKLCGAHVWKIPKPSFAAFSLGPRSKRAQRPARKRVARKPHDKDCQRGLSFINENANPAHVMVSGLWEVLSLFSVSILFFACLQVG